MEDLYVMPEFRGMGVCVCWGVCLSGCLSFSEQCYTCLSLSFLTGRGIGKGLMSSVARVSFDSDGGTVFTFPKGSGDYSVCVCCRCV